MIWQVPDAADTVVCAPDDRWRYHPKHVEQFPDINKLCNVDLIGCISEYKMSSLTGFVFLRRLQNNKCWLHFQGLWYTGSYLPKYGTVHHITEDNNIYSHHPWELQMSHNESAIRDTCEIWQSWYSMGARGGAVGWGTALQDGRSRVRFPMVSLEFFIDIILLAAVWPWGRLSL